MKRKEIKICKIKKYNINNSNRKTMWNEINHIDVNTINHISNFNLINLNKINNTNIYSINNINHK